MEKKTIPPAPDRSARLPAPDAGRSEVGDRDRPLVGGGSIHVLEQSEARPDLEIRGRRYRMGAGDGFIGIWHRRTGEQVATFMEDAPDAASQRFTELEDARSLTAAATRSWAWAMDHWYAIAALLLGGLTVVYLKSEDPALSPTESSGQALAALAPQVAPLPGGLGFAVARELGSGQLLKHEASTRRRPQTKKNEERSNRPPHAGGQSVPDPTTTPSSGAAGGSSGQAGGSTQGAGSGGGGDSSDPPSSGGGGPRPTGATGPHEAPPE